MQFRHAITIRAERAELERRWRQEYGDAEWARQAEIRFSGAPGDRGTEIHVTLEESALGAAVKKVTGSSPGAAAKDDLRHFKQLVETGEIVRAELAT